jgi:hypothetical protein
MFLAALQFILRVCGGGCFMFCFIFFCHWLSPVDFRLNYPRASQVGQTPSFG